MIINCEKCGSKFNLDEKLLNENGSKVRCSVCKTIFIVMPPEPEEEDSLDTSLEETVDLDSPPAFEEDDKLDFDDDITEDDFDRAFEDVLNEDLQEEEIEAAEEEITEPETKPEKVKEKNRKPFILAVIIAAFVLILGALSVYLFAPDLLPDRQSETKPAAQEDINDTGGLRLDFVDLSGSFVPTDKSGEFFVIKGKVINNYPQSRSHILLKGTLEDEKKNPLDRKLAYAGNIFTEHELKDISIKEIETRLKNKSGKNNSNIDVAPQESVPFMIVFYNLPDSMSTYVVETVSSSPGQ